MTCRIDPPLSLNEFKRGDAFGIVYAVPASYGGSISTVESTVTNNRDFSLAFTVASQGLIDNYYRWAITATGEQTATFPVQNLRFDIKKTYNDGSPQHTETIIIPVKEAETP